MTQRQAAGVCLAVILGCTLGCGSKGRPDAWDSGRPEGAVVDAGSPDDTARAVLRDGVLFIEETRDEWTRAMDGDEWTVRQAGTDLKVGSVLWLADAAVRVTRMDTRAGATVVNVEEVGLAQLFQTLSLAQDFDLSAAIWDTDEPGAAIEDVDVASEKAPNYTKFTRRLRLPVPESWQESSLKMELSLGLGGSIDFDFEGDDDTPRMAGSR